MFHTSEAELQAELDSALQTADALMRGKADFSELDLALGRVEAIEARLERLERLERS